MATIVMFNFIASNFAWRVLGMRAMQINKANYTDALRLLKAL